MAITFQLNLGTSSVEILLNGKVAATICPDEEEGIVLMSDHIQTVRRDDEGSRTIPPISNIRITFVP